MNKTLMSALLAILSSCAGSGGTETGNPASLDHFVASECKSRPPEAERQALVLASDADGLQCVEWTRGGTGALTLRLLNFPEACGDTYFGKSSLLKDGTLALSVYKDTCEVFRCGTCVFDFEFQLSGIDTGSALSLETGSATCEGQPTTWEESLQLAVDEQAEGVMCRYLRRNALEQLASGRGSCGQRNMPCGDCATPGEQSCAPGLTCAVIADGDARCLAGCASDEDCGGTMACRDGACRSETDW